MNRYKDNVVFVLQKTIEALKIKVTKSSVKEFLLSHPHYPSLKSVCDALKKWNIEHYPLNLKTDEIKELHAPFIAHLKISGGMLAFVEKIEDEQAIFFTNDGKRQKEGFETFAESLSGAVIVMQAGENTGKKDYLTIKQTEIIGKLLLPLGIVSVLGFVLSGLYSSVTSAMQYAGYIYWGLITSKVIGFTASLMLVMHELKIHTAISDKICGFSSKTDCDAVLNSDGSKLYGWINWADAGLIYFTATLIYLTGIKEVSSLGLLSVLSALSLPYPVYSVYYQAVKTKKWCPFCLVVQIILIVEFLSLLPLLTTVTFTETDLFRLTVSFLVPASIWLMYRAYRIKYIENDREHNSFLQFKRNPEIFGFLLKSDVHADINIKENRLQLGSPNAPVTVTAFLSLYCAPCADAYIKLKHLLDNCAEIKIDVVLNVYDDEESHKLINVVYNLFNTKSSKALEEFLYKWYNTLKPSRQKLYEKLVPDGFDIADSITTQNKQLFEKHKVAGTPTIYVNGYKYPSQYEYGDMEYYIDEIIKISTESKRQEACCSCK